MTNLRHLTASSHMVTARIDRMLRFTARTPILLTPHLWQDYCSLTVTGPHGSACALSETKKEAQMFNEKELSYLKSQRLARIATVSSALQPDVAPVGFEFDGEHFFIGGILQLRTNKYKNVASGNGKVALVVDDVESDDPWKPRGIKIHGRARVIDRPGQYGPYLEVTPEKTWSWGIDSAVFEDGKVIMKKGTSAAKKR